MPVYLLLVLTHNKNIIRMIKWIISDIRIVGYQFLVKE